MPDPSVPAVAAPHARGVRHRPADRRRIILDAAARTFSAYGYHGTTLDAIATEVGISVPALYRHFPTKYALFAETSRGLADTFRDSVNDVPDLNDPAVSLTALLDALVSTTMANRGGGLYRWQSRFLAPADADYVRTALAQLHRRIHRAVLAVRRDVGLADLPTPMTGAIATAAISAVGSPATHRAPLPTKQVAPTLTANAVRMVAADSPISIDLPTDSQADGWPTTGLPPASKREVILRQSIRLFAERGFHEVSIDDIARRAGLPASGVYRHYTNKAAILETAFWRANDRMIAAIDDALATARTPADAVARLAARYVELCTGSSELIGVYLSELSQVGDDQRTALRRQQRHNIDEWANWVAAARSDATLAQARYLVHAAVNIASDLSHAPTSAPPDLTTALINRFLLGDGATPSRDR